MGLTACMVDMCCDLMLDVHFIKLFSGHCWFLPFAVVIMIAGCGVSTIGCGAVAAPVVRTASYGCGAVAAPAASYAAPAVSYAAAPAIRTASYGCGVVAAPVAAAPVVRTASYGISTPTVVGGYGGYGGVIGGSVIGGGVIGGGVIGGGVIGGSVIGGCGAPTVSYCM